MSHIRSKNIQLDEAIVSFTFDDAPGTAFTNGGNILTKHGYSGTFYIALSFLDSLNPSYRFTKAHLETAIQDNHELGCHTHNHLELCYTDFNQGVQDIHDNQEHLSSLFKNLEFENFSYPFGAQTKAIKQFVGQKFRSARGIQAGFNQGKTDLLNLKANKLYENSVPITEVYRTIDQAVQRKAWLIFYTHDVKENPSKYGCSPNYLKSAIEVCSDLGLKVLPVRDVLQLIENKSNIVIQHA